MLLRKSYTTTLRSYHLIIKRIESQDTKRLKQLNFYFLYIVKGS